MCAYEANPKDSTTLRARMIYAPPIEFLVWRASDISVSPRVAPGATNMSPLVGLAPLKLNVSRV